MNAALSSSGSASRRVVSVRSGYGVLRILLAVVLLIAAALKGRELITEPTIGISWLGARWLLLATVEFELFLGIWLLSNLLPKPTWVVALACFGLFTCGSLYKALSGYASCGCYGRVPVNPWYTSVFDLGIVLSLLRWRPEGEGSFVTIRLMELLPRAAVVLAIWLAVGVPIALAMGVHSGPAQLTKDGVVLGEGNVVNLEPQQWVGNRFPLLPYIEEVFQSVNVGKWPLRERLAEGEWLIVFYRSSCPKCREMLDYYRQNVEQGSHGSKPSVSVAIVELPPIVSETMPDWCERGKLWEGYRWFLKTPSTIHLRNGVVESGKDEASVVEETESSGSIAW